MPRLRAGDPGMYRRRIAEREESEKLNLAQILENRHRRVATVDTDDAAAGMRAGTAQIEAWHGRARREALVPHVRRQALALEDVPPGEAHFLLDVGRAEDLCIDDGRIDVRAEARERIEGEGADLVAAAVPVALGKLVRHILREHAHRLCAGRRNGRIVRTLEVKLAPQLPGQFAAARGGVA